MDKVKFKDILTIKHGYAFKGEYFCSNDTGYLLVTPGNFSLAGGFIETNKFYSNLDFPKEFILKTGDLIVTMTDLSKEADTIGFGALVPYNKNHQYLHNQRIGLVNVFNPDYAKEYIYWVMRSSHYQRSIAATSNGATVHHTSPDRIYKYSISKIDITTQRKIASILSTYDDLIEKNNRKIEILQEMAEELYKEWFVRFRFPGYKTAKFIDGIPEGWEYVRLENIANISTGKCNREDAEEDGVYPLFDRSQEIKKSNTWIKDCEAIIVPGEGTSFIPRYYKGKFNLHQRCYCVEPKQGNIGFFLFQTLMMKRIYFLYVATGATVPSLRQNNFTNFKVLLPNEDLYASYNRYSTTWFEEITKLEQQNENLKQQRDLLLPRLMSGKLEVKVS